MLQCELDSAGKTRLCFSHRTKTKRKPTTRFTSQKTVPKVATKLFLFLLVSSTHIYWKIFTSRKKLTWNPKPPTGGLVQMMFLSHFLWLFWGCQPLIFQGKLLCYLVGGWTNPSEQYATIKLDHLTRIRGKKTCLKPPPSHSWPKRF